MISPLARIYAKSLFDSSDLKRMEKILLELRELPKVLKPFNAVFLSPSLSLEEKFKLLESCLSGRIDPGVLNLLKLMTKMGRFEQFEFVEPAFEQLLDEATGVTRGVVYSSHSLNEDEREKIEISLMKLTKKSNVILKYEVDPELLGGIVAKVGGLVFDSSLRTYLTSLSRVTTA